MTLLSTREVAKLLRVNEKMVYTLVADKGLPATRLTGKWAFPRHLVEQWVEANTVNYPQSVQPAVAHKGLLVIAGSNDPLLERVITHFNKTPGDFVAVYANLGSMGGLRVLKQGLCHIAACHLLQDDEKDYNFDFADSELDSKPVLVNFCRREQGILLAKGNPKGITSVGDLKKPGIRIVNRSLETGTRLLFDRELAKAGIKPARIKGYDVEVARHLDAGLEILAGRADAAPGIRTIAGQLDLDFLPLRWERFDFLIPREKFFDRAVQSFLGLLKENTIDLLIRDKTGYDLEAAGKIVYPNPSG